MILILSGGLDCVGFGLDCVGFVVLEWERNRPVFLVCGRGGEEQNRHMSFSCGLHFFPLGGRKWQAGWKDLKSEVSKDCLHSSSWTLGGPSPHHGVTLYPESSQPLRDMTPQKLICCGPWQASGPTSPTRGKLRLREGQQLSKYHTDYCIRGDMNNSDI